MDTVTEARKVLKEQLQSLTDEIRQLEPIAFAGQQAAEQILRIEANIRDIENGITRIDDDLAAYRPSDWDPEIYFAKEQQNSSPHQVHTVTPPEVGQSSNRVDIHVPRKTKPVSTGRKLSKPFRKQPTFPLKSLNRDWN